MHIVAPLLIQNLQNVALLSRIPLTTPDLTFAIVMKIQQLSANFMHEFDELCRTFTIIFRKWKIMEIREKEFPR